MIDITMMMSCAAADCSNAHCPCSWNKEGMSTEIEVITFMLITLTKFI